MKNKTYYLGYENTLTGRTTFTEVKLPLKEMAKEIRNRKFNHSLSEWVSTIIEDMELNEGKGCVDTQNSLLVTMMRTYEVSDRQFGNEDFYIFRTNGERFHTLGRKLWKGAKRADAVKVFNAVIGHDYDSVYKVW
jgi:hypothetical protein